GPKGPAQRPNGTEHGGAGRTPRLNSKPDFSRKITFVVHGDLASQFVTDSHREYSKKLVLAAREREQGHRGCVVDGNGFVDLIDGYPAPCRELQRAQGADDGVFVLTRSED
ncbi:hypothetical protein ACFW2Z_31425, partial [Streptomyces sp. NPDC058866]